MQVKCTSCGAVQSISQNQNCDFCGNIIELESASDNYKNIVQSETGNLMQMAETSLDATNYEEALTYFNRVLEKDISNSDAWLGKGISIVYTSKLGDIKINEAIAYWKNTIKYSSNQQAMSKRVAKEIIDAVNSFFPRLVSHFKEFRTLDDSYKELVSRFITLLQAIDYAAQIDSQNVTIYHSGYLLCKTVVKIPRDYASMDMKYASLKGVLADDAKKSAKLRKYEIMLSSKAIYEIEHKYIENIKRLDPSIETENSEEEFKNSAEGIQQEFKELIKKDPVKGIKFFWEKATPKTKLIILGIIIVYTLVAIFGKN